MIIGFTLVLILVVLIIAYVVMTFTKKKKKDSSTSEEFTLHPDHNAIYGLAGKEGVYAYGKMDDEATCQKRCLKEDQCTTYAWHSDEPKYGLGTFAGGCFGRSDKYKEVMNAQKGVYSGVKKSTK